MKRIISFLLVFVFCFSLSVMAVADYSCESEQVSIISPVGDENRAEETTWVIRRYNGLIQRRLWSITYGIWLTDWETIGYYDP